MWALLGQFQVHSETERIMLFGTTDSTVICDSGDRKRKQQGKTFFNLYFEISICSLNLLFKINTVGKHFNLVFILDLNK